MKRSFFKNFTVGIKPITSFHNARSLFFLLLVAAFATGQTSQADEYHYNNMLIGDRASGMGGAYVGIADDPAGLYYNPAGIVQAIGSNISGSMNAYHNITTRYKNALGGQYDWVRESAVLAPNFFGMFQPFAGGKLGFSYAVIDTIIEDQNQEFNNFGSISSYVIDFNNQDATYQFGPSYAFDISDKLSMGITVYGHVRSQENINNQIITLSGGTNYEWNNTYEYNEETGLRPILGLLWSPMDKVSIGVTLSKTLVTDSKHEVHNTCKGITNTTGTPIGTCDNSNKDRNITNSTQKRDLPLRISTGIAYFYNERILFSGDLNYFSSTSASFEKAKASVINFSLGTEYYLNPEWALRGGFYTNMANTPELQTRNVTGVQDPHVDLYGLSFSTSHFSRNSVLSFGFNTMFGSGKAQLFPASGGTAQLQNVEINTLTLFLSATYSY